MLLQLPHQFHRGQPAAKQALGRGHPSTIGANPCQGQTVRTGVQTTVLTRRHIYRTSTQYHSIPIPCGVPLPWPCCFGCTPTWALQQNEQQKMSSKMLIVSPSMCACCMYLELSIERCRTSCGKNQNRPALCHFPPKHNNLNIILMSLIVDS